MFMQASLHALSTDEDKQIKNPHLRIPQITISFNDILQIHNVS